MKQAISILHSAEGRAGHNYCLQRGLPKEIIKSAYLGYNPASRYEHWGDKQVFLPAGIVIPWIELPPPQNGSERPPALVWKVNIRQLPNKNPKYLCAGGSANGLYGVSGVRYGDVVVMVEGEICALSLQTAVPGKVTPVATGSATGSRTLTWIARLALADRIILAFDNDKAGDDASDWWYQRFPDTATRLRPTRHDVNDMLTAGDDISGWLASAL